MSRGQEKSQLKVTWNWKPATPSIMAISGQEITSHFDAHFLKWPLEHKMTRPYTFTDGCQLKKHKNLQLLSATFTFIYLKIEISLIWDRTFEAVGTTPSLAFYYIFPP